MIERQQTLKEINTYGGMEGVKWRFFWQTYLEVKCQLSVLRSLPCICNQTIHWSFVVVELEYASHRSLRLEISRHIEDRRRWSRKIHFRIAFRSFNLYWCSYLSIMNGDCDASQFNVHQVVYLLSDTWFVLTMSAFLSYKPGVHNSSIVAGSGVPMRLNIRFIWSM